ncbi:MAG TPA: helix-turn-helix domain-containing protein [Saprospiraceae bacterium]|nr:helix-turn-helix domain-containing protein [Saprospiraceae bacterium]HMP24321.1 helix-turn-helix domain-containing protein [Saprospiraceae bacterium]
MENQIVLMSVPKDELKVMIMDAVKTCLKFHDPRPTDHADNTADHAEFMTKRQVAKMLSCSTSTVDNYRRAGKLTPYYLGEKYRAVRFKRKEVLGLLEDQPDLLTKKK